MNEKINPHIWFNGKFLLQDKVNISPLSHGLHYGTGAFEGIHVYNGKIFKLEEHIKRLFISAKTLLMEIPFLVEEVMQACLEVILLNKVENGYIRPLIFLGDQKIAVGAENAVNILVACWQRPSIYHKNLADKKSLRLTISSLIKPPADSFPYVAKASGLYILNHLAKKRAIAEGYDDALMIDCRKFIAEATTSNFFMVKNGDLYTPTPECCLNGITRQLVIKLARESNIHVIERDMHVEELAKADEAFLTGTVAEITAISSIGEHEYKDNPVSQMLYSKFYRLTQSERIYE